MQPAWFPHTPAMMFRVLLLTLPVLALFAIPAVGFAALVVAWQGAPRMTMGHLLPGLLCSLGVWLVVAVLHFRQARFRVAVANPAAWLEEVRARLLQMGYAVRLQTDRRLVVEPRFSSLLFGEGIGVVIKDGTAVVLGPRLYLKRLRRAVQNIGNKEPAAGPPERALPSPAPFRSDTLAVVRAWRACDRAV